MPSILGRKIRSRTKVNAKFHWHDQDLGFHHADIKRGTPQLNSIIERLHRSSQQEFYQLFSYKDKVDREAKPGE